MINSTNLYLQNLFIFSSLLTAIHSSYTMDTIHQKSNEVFWVKTNSSKWHKSTGKSISKAANYLCNTDHKNSFGNILISKLTLTINNEKINFIPNYIFLSGRFIQNIKNSS